MVAWSDFYKTSLAILNAITAPGTPSSALSIGPSSPSNPVPIRTVVCVTRTSSNPTGTLVVEGSLDNVNWWPLFTTAAMPTVGSPKMDSVDGKGALYVRANPTALSAGNLTVDLMVQGDGAT